MKQKKIDIYKFLESIDLYKALLRIFLVIVCVSFVINSIFSGTFMEFAGILLQIIALMVFLMCIVVAFLG